MNWKLNARIRKLIVGLPLNLSYQVYYFLQRNVGVLRNLPLVSRLLAGITIVDNIYNQGRTIKSKTCLEVGTGWRLNLPIALWLCGASEVITVDLNPYLKEELVLEDISYIRNNQQEIKGLFESYAQQPIFQDRFDVLIHSKTTLDSMLDMMNIRYLSPANAGCIDLPTQSIDYHVSNNVFEHIAPEVIENILLEGKRILKPDGLFVHLVDLSDHFSHSDKSISEVNFLQFSESEWKNYTSRFMYHNRLRIDDYVNLIDKVGLESLFLDTEISLRALEELNRDFRLDEDFRDKSIDTNAVTKATIVAFCNRSL